LFHLSIGSLLNLGLFPFVMIVAWLPFLPNEVWGRRKEAPPAAGPSVTRSSPGADLVVGALFLAVIAHNIETLRSAKPAPRNTGILHQINAAFRLEQRWSLWSRPPPNQWRVAPARDPNGSQIDLLRHGAPLLLTSPRCAPPNHRWWRFELGVTSLGGRFADRYARWLAQMEERRTGHPVSEARVRAIVARPGDGVRCLRSG